MQNFKIYNYENSLDFLTLINLKRTYVIRIDLDYLGKDNKNKEKQCHL